MGSSSIRSQRLAPTLSYGAESVAGNFVLLQSVFLCERENSPYSNLADAYTLGSGPKHFPGDRFGTETAAGRGGHI